MAILLIFLAAVAGYLGYDGFSGVLDGVKGRQDRVVVMRDSVTTLTKEVDSAKAVLATGSIDQLRRRLEGYRQSLDLLRRLVPEASEVPNLLDQISTRSKIRGVELNGIRPGVTVAGPPPFATNQYDVTVLGHYDQLGEFLSDIASLPRIIVPVGLKLGPAPGQAAQVLGDSTGALLSASFTIRTYVKTGKEAADSAQ
ncbi:MAG TPA: type 4a pilus biogenesis protein PilO [Gemmatimonadales bacterium]|nr:type 4a pilus biogenesis protein PilO [Gemmatimonadales bacterium]